MPSTHNFEFIVTPGGTLSEGTHIADAPPEDVKPIPVVSSKPTLTSLAQSGYQLLHMGLIESGYVDRRMATRNLIAEYCEEASVPNELRPMVLRTTNAIVDRLPPGYDRNLYAVPNTIWDGLSRFLDMVSFTDEQHKRYFQVIRQQIPVRDDSIKKLATPYSMVIVNFVSLSGNTVLYKYQPNFSGPLVELLTDTPLKETVEYADSLFS